MCVYIYITVTYSPKPYQRFTECDNYDGPFGIGVGGFGFVGAKGAGVPGGKQHLSRLCLERVSCKITLKMCLQHKGSVELR